jgi:hypothetical protein
MTDDFSEADRDAFAREAIAVIEAVLDRRCPEMKIAFWTAVDMLYRLDTQPRAAPRPNLDGQTPAQSG